MNLPTIRAFEAGRIDPERFDHTEHVYLAWCYLGKFELLEAIDRYRAGLKNLTRKFGPEGKYHETITWFYLIDIAGRMEGRNAEDWSAFRDGNPDLFEGNPSRLRRFYSTELLASDKARRMFVLPDRLA